MASVWRYTVKDVYNAHCQNRKLHKTDILKLWLFPPEKIQLNNDIVEKLKKIRFFHGKFLQTQKLMLAKMYNLHC